MKKLKWLIPVILLILAFLSGILVSFLFDTGLLPKLGNSFLHVPWYLYIILFVLMFYITLSVHEFTHLFTFNIYGIKGKAIYLTAFLFIKENNKWKFKFRLKMFSLMGGLVIPDIKNVRTEEEYNAATKAFYKSLIAAPLASIVFCVLFFISFLLIWIFAGNYILIGIFSSSLIYIIIFTVIYMLASSVKSSFAVGDFPAYKMMKNDPYFSLSQILQYLSFSSDVTEETSKFMFGKVVDTLLTQNNYYTQFNMLLITYYLEGVIFDKYEINEEVSDRILKMSDPRLIKNEIGLAAFCYKVCYIYVFEDYEKAVKIFETMTPSFKNEKMYQYYLKKTGHMLNLSDESEYLSNEGNLDNGKMGFVFEPVIDEKADMERNNIRLEPKIVINNQKESVE